MMNHFKKFKQLNCFGFNSGKFDLPVLMPYIASWSVRHSIPIKALKRGNIYITIELGDIIFKGFYIYIIIHIIKQIQCFSIHDAVWRNI